MPDTMRAVLCRNPGELEIVHYPVPDRKAGEALVKIRRIGVCGTDMHIYQGNQPYFAYPRVMGHELSGEIVEAETGSALRPGDAVYIVPYLHCGHCIACRAGKTNCCTTLKVLGVHIDGGMCEYLSLPETHLFKAEGITLDEAAMVERYGAVYAAAMGIENPFGKALDKNLGRKHIVAQTNASNASAIASKADANYKNLVGPALANKYNADANKSNYLADNDGSSGKKPLEVPAPKSNPIEPDKALKLPRANVARSTMLATIQAETGSTNKTVSNYVTQQFNQIYNDAVSTTERYYAEQKAQGKLKGDPMFNEFNENVDKLIDAKVQQWLRLDRSQDIDALKKNIQTRKSAIVTSNATSTD